MSKMWERLMSDEGRRWLRRASYLLIAVGVVLLIIAGVNIGYRQWERRRIEARLTRTAPTATKTPRVTAVATTAEPQEPTDTPEPPTPTLEPSATATVAAETEPSPTLAATATPTLAPTPTTAPVAAAAELPVHLAFADLEIDAPVVEMGWEVDEIAGVRTSVWRLEDIKGGVVGHLINSALPGQAGNVVMAGHHNIEGEVFKNLSLVWDDDDAEQQEDGVTWRSDKLDGRTITVGDAAGQSFTYVVEGMFKLPDKNVSQAQREANGRLMAPTDEPTLTLVTCWPFHNNTHRIVVVARLAGMEG